MSNNRFVNPDRDNIVNETPEMSQKNKRLEFSEQIAHDKNDNKDQKRTSGKRPGDISLSELQNLRMQQSEAQPSKSKSNYTEAHQ